MTYHGEAHNLSHPSPYPRIQEFLSRERHITIDEYRSLDAEVFQQAGLQNALGLFHEAAERVPAYRDFLKKHGVRAAAINTYRDFQHVPITTKENYLRAYPLKDLCWDGNLQGLSIFSSSSGSSGEPFAWPWGEAQKIEGAAMLESSLAEIFEVEKRSTLFIDCFAMGTWIAGIFTCGSMGYLSLKGYPLLTITPGLDKKSAFALFQKLAPEFNQIIFGGYPPFIKDLLEEGRRQGLAWERYRVKFFFAAEGFSERWRDRVHRLVGAPDPFTTSINIYGSSDAAILAYETPLSIAIRRAIERETPHVQHLFSQSYLPTLAQYDPRLKFFEAHDQTFVFSTRSGIPLLRYDIGDRGGVYSFYEMRRLLADCAIDMQGLLSRHQLANYYWKLPFVYLSGRRDFTISLYGLLIYPEHVKVGLEKQAFQGVITGKFVMAVDSDADQNPSFRLIVELAPGSQPGSDLRDQIQQAVVEGLREVNSEYHELESMIGERALPHVEMVEYNSSDLFQGGQKQRWVGQESKRAEENHKAQ